MTVAIEGSRETDIQMLLERFPLPEGVGKLDTYIDTTSVNGVAIRLAGIATEFGGECATGSAASLDELPLLRAYMELVERVAILAAMQSDQPQFLLCDRAGHGRASVARESVFPMNPEPTRWRWARSSGVAVGLTWDAAATRARLELVERDRVLRCWYGEFKPEPIIPDKQLVPSSFDSLYSFGAYSFGGPDGAAVAGIFGAPCDGAAAPALLGFAARGDQRAALEAAFRESLQPLGFLFGEELPTSVPVASATPDFHQDYFLFPPHIGRLRSWLQGEHCQHRGVLEASPAGEPDYVDLTPPSLASRLFVVRAIPVGHVPLAFGSRHPMVRSNAPRQLWVHPIA